MGVSRPVESSSGQTRDPGSSGTVEVAWYQADIHPYRVPLIRRLADDPGLRLRVYADLRDDSRRLHYGDVSVAPSVIVDVWSWRLPRGRPRTLMMGGLWQTLRQRPGVVVLPDNVHNLIVWLFWAASFLGGPRIALFGYGLRPANLGHRLLAPWRRLLQRMLMARVVAFGTYTEAGRQAVLEAGYPPERAVTVANTLDTGYLMSIETPRARHVLAESLDLREGAPLLIFIGRMQQSKRLDILIAAVRSLEAEDFPVDLVLVGDGPDRERCAAQVEGMKGVTVLPGEYDPRRLAPYLSAADLLTIPGRVGLTCVHGFAYGLPCITISGSLVEQSPEFEYLIDGENGVVVDSDDPREYAAAVRAVLEDDAWRNRMRARALQSAQQLSMDAMAENFREMINLASMDERR